jgi:hypothetical protein
MARLSFRSLRSRCFLGSALTESSTETAREAVAAARETRPSSEITFRRSFQKEMDASRSSRLRADVSAEARVLRPDTPPPSRLHPRGERISKGPSRAPGESDIGAAARNLPMKRRNPAIEEPRTARMTTCDDGKPSERAVSSTRALLWKWGIPVLRCADPTEMYTKCCTPASRAAFAKHLPWIACSSSHGAGFLAPLVGRCAW